MGRKGLGGGCDKGCFAGGIGRGLDLGFGIWDSEVVYFS